MLAAEPLVRKALVPVPLIGMDWMGLDAGLVALSSTIVNVMLLAVEESAWKIARFPVVNGICAGAVSEKADRIMPATRAAVSRVFTKTWAKGANFDGFAVGMSIKAITK